MSRADPGHLRSDWLITGLSDHARSPWISSDGYKMGTKFASVLTTPERSAPITPPHSRSKPNERHTPDGPTEGGPDKPISGTLIRHPTYPFGRLSLKNLIASSRSRKLRMAVYRSSSDSEPLLLARILFQCRHTLLSLLKMASTFYLQRSSLDTKRSCRATAILIAIAACNRTSREPRVPRRSVTPSPP
jgi:hypothetical protein